MPKIQPYTQRYKPQTTQATGEMFGAGVGRAQAQLGQVGADISTQLRSVEVRNQTRAETLDRVLIGSNFDNFAQTESIRLKDESNLSSPTADKDYNVILDNNMNEALNNHQGSDESKMLLQADLIAKKTSYLGTHRKLVTTAQLEAVKNNINNYGNSLADTAGDAPDQIDALFDQARLRVEQMSAALPNGTETEVLRSMQSNIFKSAFQRYVDAGDYDSAEALLGGDNIAVLLDQDTMRQSKTTVIVGKRKLEKDNEALERGIRQMESIMGKKMTPEQRDAFTVGGSPTQNLYNVQLMGGEVTDQMWQKAYGVPTAEEGAFGTSLKGRAISIMSNDAVGFANNTLTQEQEQNFMSAITEYTQPTQFQNPNNGLWETRIPNLPPHVQEALERRGVQTPSSQAGQGEVINVNEPLSTDAPTDPAKTIWGRRSNIAGIVPAAARAVGQTPGIGGFIEGGGEFTIDKQYAVGLQKDLVRVLQNNPRYAEGERQAIEKEVSILSSAWDNQAAYEKRLVGMDESLEKRENQAFKTGQSKMVSVEERKHAMNVLNGIRMFRDHLGVPIRVKTVDEAKALPPGTPFISPNGQLMFNNIIAPAPVGATTDDAMSGVK